MREERACLSGTPQPPDPLDCGGAPPGGRASDLFKMVVRHQGIVQSGRVPLNENQSHFALELLRESRAAEVELATVGLRKLNS